MGERGTKSELISHKSDKKTCDNQSNKLTSMLNIFFQNQSRSLGNKVIQRLILIRFLEFASLCGQWSYENSIMCFSVPNWHIVPIMQSIQPRLSVHDIINCSCRNVPKAQDIWDDIVMAYPTDILALKMLSDYSTFYGPKERVRDSVARVFPHWKQDSPLYGYNGNLCGSGDIFKFSKWLISFIEFIISLYQFALRVPLISFVWNLMVWWIKTKNVQLDHG